MYDWLLIVFAAILLAGLTFLVKLIGKTAIQNKPKLLNKKRV